MNKNRENILLGAYTGDLIQWYNDNKPMFNIEELPMYDQGELLLEDYVAFRDRISAKKMGMYKQREIIRSAINKNVDLVLEDFNFTQDLKLWLAQQVPHIFKKYKMLLEDRMNVDIWETLIAADVSFKYLLTNNLASVRAFPTAILKYVDFRDVVVSDIEHVNMTAKVLVTYICKNNLVPYVSDEVKQYLREKLTVEMLSGKSKNTKKLSEHLEQFK